MPILIFAFSQPARCNFTSFGIGSRCHSTGDFSPFHTNRASSCANTRSFHPFIRTGFQRTNLYGGDRFVEQLFSPRTAFFRPMDDFFGDDPFERPEMFYRQRSQPAAIHMLFFRTLLHAIFGEQSTERTSRTTASPNSQHQHWQHTRPRSEKRPRTETFKPAPTEDLGPRQKLEKALGQPVSTQAECRAAYRKWALKNHPDKVAPLGVTDTKRAEATQRFQTVTDLKDLVYKRLPE